MKEVDAMQLTSKAQAFLANGVPVGMPEDSNPFVRESGQMYLRYDGITIENADDAFGGVNVCFEWRGVVTYRMRVASHPGMNGGALLMLSGIEGRMRMG